MSQRIESKLHEVHDQIVNKIQINKKAAIDRLRAQEMEAILYQIKNLKNNPSNSIEGLLSEQAQILINQSLNMLNMNRKGTNRLKGDDLFHRSHAVSTSYGGDDIFEEELAAVLSVIEKEATGSTLGIANRLVGGKSANIKLQGEINKDINKIMTKLIQRTAKRVNTEGQLLKEKHWTPPVARPGKIDVNGLSEIHIESDLHPAWKDLYRVFSGCTFSVKNYSSYFSNQLNIHLGSTDYYKALYGSLSSLNYSQEQIDKIIYSGLASYNKSKNKTVASHFYHLRFIYELTGIGLYDSQGDPISGVDFLIYNDPSSDAIFVRSTADLIAQELENERVGSPLGGVSIAKANFKQT